MVQNYAKYERYEFILAMSKNKVKEHLGKGLYG